jgi:hypothetical protein
VREREREREREGGDGGSGMEEMKKILMKGNYFEMFAWFIYFIQLQHREWYAACFEIISEK